jgi:hypothetical protein
LCFLLLRQKEKRNGKVRLSREVGASAPGSADFRQSQPLEKFFSIRGSRRLTNGGVVVLSTVSRSCGLDLANLAKLFSGAF